MYILVHVHGHIVTAKNLGTVLCTIHVVSYKQKKEGVSFLLFLSDQTRNFFFFSRQKQNRTEQTQIKRNVQYNLFLYLSLSTFLNNYITAGWHPSIGGDEKE